MVPAGNNTTTADHAAYQTNKAIVYFEPGIHYIAAGMYTGHNSAYLGGYGNSIGKAILDGIDGGTNETGKGGSEAVTSLASSGNNVYNTWEYLTVENYSSSENSAVMGNVNGAGSDIGDTYKYDTIGPNEYGYSGNNSRPRWGQSSGGGYGIDAGSNTTIEYSCLAHNAQGAFNIWQNAANINIRDNEISWNGLGEYPDSVGTGASPFACGCSGGGKIFSSLNANFVGNYVHDNYNAGVWFDSDNAGANISRNYIASNWGEGIVYEASYNAQIVGNTLVGNGWASDAPWPAGIRGGSCSGGVSCTNGFGPVTGAGGGNPYAAIDLSNSGGNGNLHTRYAGQVLVERNVLLNNFGGVKVYTDTNRYPGNIDNDSACSLPLGVLGEPHSSIYYKQGKVLTTNADTSIDGSTVISSGGTKTVCANYGSAGDYGTGIAVQAPSDGMAVYDQNSGKFLGNVASVATANSFTLDRSPGNEVGTSLLLSAYSGCGPADYYGGGLNMASGKPRANYWDNCIWGSRNVTVQDDLFSLDVAAVRGCSNAKNLCGYMELAAFNAGVPRLMQFFDSYETYIAQASGGLGNVWSQNTYAWSGSISGWRFQAASQGNSVSFDDWRAAPYGQDADSVFRMTSLTWPFPGPTGRMDKAPRPGKETCS